MLCALPMNNHRNVFYQSLWLSIASEIFLIFQCQYVSESEDIVLKLWSYISILFPKVLMGYYKPMWTGRKQYHWESVNFIVDKTYHFSAMTSNKLCSRKNIMICILNYYLASLCSLKNILILIQDVTFLYLILTSSFLLCRLTS